MALRVVVADDDAEVRSALCAVLDDDDRFVVVAEACDAAEALDAAERERPDVVLLDVRMPGGGVQAAHAIRSTGLTASLGIAEYVSGLVAELGVPLGDPAPLRPGPQPPGLGLDGPWWARTARYEAARAA